MVQLMVSSIFDSGYFASIRVIDIKSGKPLVERVQAHAERTVPGWFERLVDLQPQGGDALIMRGWEQAARVEVVSHPQFALARLWDSALGSLYWLLACGAASLLLGGWLLRRQLRRSTRWCARPMPSAGGNSSACPGCRARRSCAAWCRR